jgi:hypothetical protein
MLKLSMSVMSILFFIQMTIGQEGPPGVVVGYSPADTGVYLGSPSIAILSEGHYLATYQPFGKKLKKAGDDGATIVMMSKDKGATWHKISTIPSLWWANIFVFQENVYLMGTEGEYGPLTIRRSVDKGHTWTYPKDGKSGLLRKDEQYHTAPVPVVVHNNRIFRAIEDRNPPEGWGTNFRAMVISAPVYADLLDSSNWVTSNKLRYKKNWPGNAWLEGNVVVGPKGKLFNILRNDYRPEGGRACVIKVGNKGNRIKFNKKSGFIDFPGGSKKFTIRYDSVSNRYWSLTNYIPERYKGKNPERTRNVLALVSSTDLRDWIVHKVVLESPDIQHTGFQYADWQFDGNDMVSLIRTAYVEPDGTKAHSQHDSNYITFYRIPNFRDHIDGMVP